MIALGVPDSKSFLNGLYDPYLYINEELYRYMHSTSKEVLDSLFSNAIEKGKHLSAYDLESSVREPIAVSFWYLKNKPNSGEVLTVNSDYTILPENYWKLEYTTGEQILRSRYIMAGVLNLHWYELPSWLEVHHIDKKTTNDNVENLFLACKLLHSYIHSEFYPKNRSFIKPSFEVLYIYSIGFIFYMIHAYNLIIQLPLDDKRCGRTFLICEHGNIKMPDFNDKDTIKKEIEILVDNLKLLNKLLIPRKKWM